jgi:hypothetical protein
LCAFLCASADDGAGVWGDGRSAQLVFVHDMQIVLGRYDLAVTAMAKISTN